MYLFFVFCMFSAEHKVKKIRGWGFSCTLTWAVVSSFTVVMPFFFYFHNDLQSKVGRAFPITAL